MKKLHWVAGLLVTAQALACAPKAKNPNRLIGKGAERVNPNLLPKRSTADPNYPPNPPSFLLATVPEKSVGPFLARGGDPRWRSTSGRARGRFGRVVSLPLGADASPFNPRIIAQVSQDATMMVVRPGGASKRRTSSRGPS